MSSSRLVVVVAAMAMAMAMAVVIDGVVVQWWYILYMSKCPRRCLAAAIAEEVTTAITEPTTTK